MDSNEKELSLTPIPGKSGGRPTWGPTQMVGAFCKMNTTPILAGLAKNRLLLNCYGVDVCQMEM